MNHEIARNLLLGAIALGTFFSGVGLLWIGSLLATRLDPKGVSADSA